MFDSECTAGHQSPRQPEEDAFTNTVSPRASPAPDCVHALTSPLSPVLISSSDPSGSQTQSVFQPPEPLIPPGGIISESPAHSSSPASSPPPVACLPPLPDPILSLPPCDLKTAPSGTTPPDKGGLISASSTNTDIQELLEIESSEKFTLEVCQERAKEGVHRVGNSLRNVLSSLDSDQDPGTPQPFGDIQGKPEQLAGPQQLHVPGVHRNRLEQECTQFFWGLPSLHSESLLHTAWLYNESSSDQCPSLAFNHVCQAEPQPEDAPYISQAEHLPQDKDEAELCSQNFPPTAAQVPTEPPLPCSIQNHPPLSQPHIRDVPYPPLQQPFIINEHQDLERSPQQLNWRKDLASKLQTTAEALSQPTAILPQVSKASQTYRMASSLCGNSIHSRLQEHKEAITRDKQQPGYFRQAGSQDLMHTPGRVTANCQCQAQCMHEPPPQPSQTPAMLALNGTRKGGRQDQERELSEDGAWSSGSILVKGWENNLSTSDCLMPQKCKKVASAGASNYLPKTPCKRHVEKVLTSHLGGKLNQVQESRISVCVQQPCLTASHASPHSIAHVNPSDQSSYKCLPSITNTSQELSFLDPKTLLILETHIVRYRVRHKWDPQLQSSDPGTLASHATPALPLAQPAVSASASIDSRVISSVKMANSPEDLQKGLVEKIPSPTLQGPVSLPQPSELLKTRSRSVTGAIHWTSVPGRKDNMDNQRPTYSFLHRTKKNGTVLETGRGRLEPSTNEAMALCEPGNMSGSNAFGDPCVSKISPDMEGMSQLSEAETSAIVKMEEICPSTGEAIIMNNPNSSGPPRANKRHSTSHTSILQEPVFERLKSLVISEIQKQVEVKLAKKSQHPPASIFQHGHTDKLSTKVSLPSQASAPTSQHITSSTVSIPQTQKEVKLGRKLQHPRVNVFQHDHTDKLSTKVGPPNWAPASTSQNKASNKVSTPQIQEQEEIKLEKKFQHSAASIFQHEQTDKLSTKGGPPSWVPGSTSQHKGRSKVSTPQIHKQEIKLEKFQLSTAGVFQHDHTDKLSTKVDPPSWASGPTSQNNPCSKVSTPQIQEQEEVKLEKKFQYYTTCIFQLDHTDKVFTKVNLASQACGSTSQNKASSKVSAPQIQNPKVKLEKEFQHPTGSMFHHDHTDKLSTKVSPPSWASGSTSQNITSSKVSTPQMKCGHSPRRMPSQEQKLPEDSKVEITGKNQRKMFNVSDGRQGCKKLAPGLLEERQPALRPSHSCGLGPLIQVDERGAIGRKTFPTPPQKTQSSPEHCVQKSMQNCLPFADRKQEDSLPKVKRSLVTPQSGAPDAQTLMRAVGKIMVDTLGLPHGDVSQQLHKDPPPTLPGRRFSYHTCRCDLQDSSIPDSSRGFTIPYQKQVSWRQGQRCPENLYVQSISAKVG
ncbi:spermatogenesis-associated protein 31E1-like isoform 2-T3 [Thomomys bottae]